MRGHMFGTRDSGMQGLGCGDTCMGMWDSGMQGLGCGDTCMGMWDSGMQGLGCGDTCMGMWDSGTGTWGREIGDLGTHGRGDAGMSRLGMQGHCIGDGRSETWEQTHGVCEHVLLQFRGVRKDECVSPSKKATVESREVGLTRTEYQKSAHENCTHSSICLVTFALCHSPG